MSEIAREVWAALWAAPFWEAFVVATVANAVVIVKAFPLVLAAAVLGGVVSYYKGKTP